ncbi:MAG: DUF1616 domain-containing protein [Methanotrichaceae archaeon]|nr:DUF1616 domain-containing protein [Methanotrichaceae archaeon]
MTKGANKYSHLEIASSILLIILLTLSIAAVFYIITMPKQGEKFTEFYILGPGWMAYDYPTSVVVGNRSMVIVGITNHEYTKINYTMQMVFENYTFFSKNITLEHNQTWKQPMTYVIYQPGVQQKLEFLLFKEKNFSAPYRDLYFWANVSQER